MSETNGMTARETAASFADEVKELAGDRLRSVMLFGSAARGEFVRGVSDVNVLVLADRVDAPLLATLAPVVREWRERMHAPPLLMDESGWARASDVFAIEIADMQDARTVLFGADPVADARVETAALRLQAERELRIKTLQLHQGMLAAAGEPEELGRLLVTALPALVTYLRVVLRLAQRAVPATMADVVRAAGDVVGASPEALLRTLEARNAAAAPEVSIDAPLLAGYEQFARRTLDHVDRFEQEREA